MKLVASLLLAVVISSCSSATTTSETSVTTVKTVTSSFAVESTSTTSTSLTPVVENSTTVVKSVVTSAPTTASSSTSMTPTSVVSTVALSRPKLSVSQTTNLNPTGTSVTVRGTGFDVSKGVYVIVCSQAAPGPQATCIGGINLDGSSPSSVWVSSNPPNYGIGLTTPFQPDGSFTIELEIVAKSGPLDCTVIKCGVVTRSDHLRYTDRTQDVFVPISFSSN